MSATRFSFRAAVAVFAAVLASTPALAESSPTEGEELFQRGRTAFGQGNYEIARSLFERSHLAEPRVGTLLNLAVCEEHLGKLRQAATHLSAAFGMVNPDDKRRDLITRRLKEVEARTPKVTIRLARPLGPDVTVSLDSQNLHTSQFEKPILIDPGPHELNCAGAAGNACAQTFTVSEGQELVRLVTIEIPPTPPPAPILPKAPSPSGAPRNYSLTYVLGGVGLASLAAGLIAGAGVFHQKSLVSEHCDPSGCDDAGMRAAATGTTLAVVSTIATTVGVIGIGGAAWTLLVTSGPKEPAIACTVSGSF